MEMPSSEELRQITVDAILRGQEEQRKKLIRIREENERKAKRDQLLAEQVLSQVPKKCRLEAAEGRTHAVVMGLEYSRDYERYPSGNLEHTALRGPGALVWNALRNAGLDCAIEYWHDGVGVNSGYNIIVKWPGYNPDED